MQQEQKLIVAMVCGNGRSEASINTAVSLMRLQTKLVHTAVKTEVHMVDHIDHAINIAAQGNAHLMAFDSHVTFDDEFPMRCMNSDKDVIVAAYPLPGFDWQRIAEKPANHTEPIQFRGNRYSATPTVLADPVDGKYVQASTARLGCVFIRRGVADAIKKDHPEIVLADGNARFAIATVRDSKVLEPHDNFARLYGKPIYIDLKCTSSHNAPCNFAGCVGMRGTLR
jgi:hypothetical protein